MLPLKTLHFPKLDSTMTWARAHVSSLDLSALTRITADKQTKGKGQFGRKWKSPLGNLYATFCFTVPIGWPDLPHAAQVLSISAAKTLEGYGLSLRLKWPNDLLVDGKKIGGVLCEVESLQDRMLLVNGIGLNVNLTEKECAQIDQPATSLSVELQKRVAVGEVVEAVTTQFCEDLNLFLKEGFEPLKGQFKTRIA